MSEIIPLNSNSGLKRRGHVKEIVQCILIFLKTLQKRSYVCLSTFVFVFVFSGVKTCIM